MDEKKQNPGPSLAARIAIIAGVIVIFIVAGALVLLERSAGGDRPAPQVTVTQAR
ncbi:MAG: hypothetical protein M1309_02705 [Actinobacteria bacterium]|nr:hypothetical protein [Actinomycetota bacterium]